MGVSIHLRQTLGKKVRQMAEDSDLLHSYFIDVVGNCISDKKDGVKDGGRMADLTLSL